MASLLVDVSALAIDVCISHPVHETVTSPIFTLPFSSIQVQVITIRPVFMSFQSCKSTSDVMNAITVYISRSHTEADASTISSHIFHRCCLQEMVARV